MMQKLFFISVFFLVSACGFNESNEPKRQTIKTSHKEISSKFQDNGVAAASFYKNKNVQISGIVNTIYDFGTVILVSEDMQPFPVSFSSEGKTALASVKKGQNIDVICKQVDSLQIRDCVLASK